MADPQQGQPPMSETMQGMPAGADPVAQFRAYLQSQQQIGPNLSRPQQQPTQAQTNRPTDYSASAGGQKASLKDFSNTVQNVVGQISNQIQRRKQQEMQQDFDRFTQAVGGIDAAKQQISSAIQDIQKNPQDMDARRRLQRAQQALTTNQEILNMDYNPHDPKGQKRMKMIQKGMGIDPKTQQTPEYQALVKSMQKSYGVSQDVAGLISRIPQTQQGQGIKPPTGGQILRAETDQAKMQKQAAIKQLELGEQRGMKDDQLAFLGELKGIHVYRGADGKLKKEEFTPEERAKIPRLKAEDDLKAAQANFDREKTNAMSNPDDPTYKLRMMDAQSKKLDAEARMKAADAAASRAAIAKLKGSGDPDSVKEARRAVTQLTEKIADTQKAMGQQNAGFFGSNKYDPAAAQQALTTLQNEKQQKQAIIDAYSQGQKQGAASTMTDEEFEQAKKDIMDSIPN